MGDANGSASQGLSFRSSTVRQRTCPNHKCRHIHAEGNPCHVFVSAPPGGLDSSSEEEESEEESESESEEEEEEEESNSDDEGPPPGPVNMSDMMNMAKNVGKGAVSEAKRAKEVHRFPIAWCALLTFV